HAGTSDVLVIEADEYDRAFLSLAPTVAAVLNVEHDHVDVFPTVADVRDAFAAFAGRIAPGGALVACADDPVAASLAEARPKRGQPTRTYGSVAAAQYRVTAPEDRADGLAFTLALGSGATVPVVLRVPGMPNALNAAAAIAAAHALGTSPAESSRALASFTGTGRRLETLGEARGVTVVDDYAHHPSEIRASIAAMRSRARGRLVVIFQPHTPSRLRAFFDDFAAALRAADDRLVVETFQSAREAADERGGARALAERAGALYAADAEAAARTCWSPTKGSAASSWRTRGATRRSTARRSTPRPARRSRTWRRWRRARGSSASSGWRPCPAPSAVRCTGTPERSGGRPPTRSSTRRSWT